MAAAALLKSGDSWGLVEFVVSGAQGRRGFVLE